MNVARYYRIAALGLVLHGVLGCTPSAPTDTGPPIPPTVNMAPQSSEEAAAEQAKTASKKP